MPIIIRESHMWAGSQEIEDERERAEARVEEFEGHLQFQRAWPLSFGGRGASVWACTSWNLPPRRLSTTSARSELRTFHVLGSRGQF